MLTGSVGEGRLRRKKSYLLSLRLSKLSSVFKTRSFQSKNHASSLFLYAPQISRTLTLCLEHCTLFLEDEDDLICSLWGPSGCGAPNASLCA